MVTFAAPGDVADDEGERLALTLPGLVPPRATIAAVASSRLNAVERSRHDDRLAGEHRVLIGSGGARRPAEVDAGGAQLLDERPVVGLGEPGGDRRRRSPPPTPGDGGQIVGRRRHHRVERAEPRRQRLRCGRPEVADAEGGQQPRQRPVASAVDRRQQLLRADRGEALQPEQLLLGEGEEIGDVADQAGRR